MLAAVWCFFQENIRLLDVGRWFVGWLVGRCWLFGWLVGWLVVGWLVGWLVSWMVWLVGRFVVVRCEKSSVYTWNSD